MTAAGKVEVRVFGATPEIDAQLLEAAAAADCTIASSIDLQHYRDHAGRAPVAIVCVDPNPQLAFKAVQHLAASDADSAVIVLSTSNDANQVLQAMRAGAKDYALLDPELGDVFRALRAIVEARAAGDEHGGPTGKIVSVLGVKGGVGATTIAANVAGLSTGLHGRHTILVDLDLELGDCVSFLDVEPRATLATVIRNLAKLDAEMLRGMVSIHPATGLHVLAQTDHPEEIGEVTAERLGRLLSTLSKQYELVLIDGLRGFGDLAITALDASDHVLLVLTPDVPSVKNTRRTLSILGRLSYPDDRITLVLNRWDKKSGLDAPVIADTVGRKIDALVTNDFPDTIDAINRGVLLQEAAPGAKVTRDLADLVQKLAGRAEAPRRSGFGARIKSWLGGREVHG